MSTFVYLPLILNKMKASFRLISDAKVSYHLQDTEFDLKSNSSKAQTSLNSN